MNLNELSDKAFRNAVAHGWYEKHISNVHSLFIVIFIDD